MQALFTDHFHSTGLVVRPASKMNHVLRAIVCLVIVMLVGILGEVAVPRELLAQEVQQPNNSPPTDFNAQAAQLMREAARALSVDRPAEVLEKATSLLRLLPDDARVQQRVAELLYRSGHVSESLKPFERANELDPAMADHNWQRGLALATAGQFEKGAEQFSDHHRVNPDDVENSAWHFLCVAKSQGLEQARQQLLPSRGDRREPMMGILSMFRQTKSPEQLLSELDSKGLQGDQLKSATFYALLYVGLYHDSVGDKSQAVQYLKRCLESDLSGYMHDAARVYLSYRFKNAGDNTDSSPQ